MRLLTTITMAIFALVGTDAYAGGIQVKKAKRKGAEKVAKKLDKIKKDCGHSSIKAPIDWTGVDKVSDEELKKARRTRHNVAGVNGKLMADVVWALARLCKDADYKAEIKKIKTIKLVSAKGFSATKASLKLSGGTLTAVVPLVTNDSKVFMKLKKLF